jgi:hypothetical protein
VQEHHSQVVAVGSTDHWDSSSHLTNNSIKKRKPVEYKVKQLDDDERTNDVSNSTATHNIHREIAVHTEPIKTDPNKSDRSANYGESGGFRIKTIGKNCFP